MDLVEGRVGYRKGKKWKTRWAVLRRVNPATEVLNLVLYPKDANAGARHKEKSLLSLKGFSGLHVLNKMDKHFNVIVIITTDDVIPLSFETIDQRTDWLAQLQGHYGKEKSFQGIVPHKQKIKSGEAVLRFYSTFFSLTKKDSYRLIGHWKLTSLPKYGAVDGGFAFQASPESLTGDKPVIYFFATRSGREIHALFDSVCRAGEGLPRQYSHSAEASQPGTSEEDNRAQPSFFKRAWRRMSGKRPRKGKAERPRSRSMPSTTRGRKTVESTELASPQGLQDNAPRVRRNESVPAFLGASCNDDVFEQEQPKSPPPGYENIAGVTPEGYTVMIPDDTPVRQSRSSSAYSPTRKGSDGRGMGTVGNGKVDGGKACDAEGYVVVEGRDEELLEKIRANSQAKEKDAKTASRDSQDGRIKSSSSTTEKREENGVIPEEDENEKQEVKLSETEKQTLKNGHVQCQIVVTPSGADDENINNGEEVIVNGQQEMNDLGKDDSDVKKNEGKPTETAVSNVDYVNGDIIQHKNNVKAKGKHGDSTATSVSTRRGLKNPPMLNLPPTSTVGSAEHLYVNSPKIVDYVNVQGGRSGALRSRNKTGSQSGGKSKLTPYAMYDGNDDSIYHSVESLMPSHPGYQNVLGDDPSRSHSFENIAGHSYANVGGAQPSYQNVGHFDRSYVNVMSRPYHGNLNYVRLAGVHSSQSTSPLPITTSPKSSDYTWIDERKTKLLQDTAKMHSERRQENLPRFMKK